MPAGGTVHTGISLRVQMQGVVPWFEEYDAMVRSHHTSETWHALSHEERAEAVAHERLSKMIALHENEAVTQHAERKQKQARKKR